MALIRICDECGKISKESLYLGTGLVFKDNKIIGYFVDLCEDHYPEKNEPGLPMRPKNCSHIEFWWPGIDPVRERANSFPGTL